MVNAVSGHVKFPFVESSTDVRTSTACTYPRTVWLGRPSLESPEAPIACKYPRTFWLAVSSSWHGSPGSIPSARSAHLSLGIVRALSCVVVRIMILTFHLGELRCVRERAANACMYGRREGGRGV